MAGRLRRLVSAVHGGGASEYRKVILVKAYFFAQVIGPGFHHPEFSPAIRYGDVFVKPPDKCPGAQPDLADLPHCGKECIAVGGIYPVVDRFQYPGRNPNAAGR